MGSDRSLNLRTVEEDSGDGGGSGGGGRFDFQRAVDLCCLPSTICIPLRVSDVVDVLVLLFQVIHRAFIRVRKNIDGMYTVCTIQLYSARTIARAVFETLRANCTKLLWAFRLVRGDVSIVGTRVLFLCPLEHALHVTRGFLPSFGVTSSCQFAGLRIRMSNVK